MTDNKKKPLPIKSIALWTGWYFVASYFVFLFLFNFDILHTSDWSKIPFITLHGFGGLGFGLALAAWIPVWFAGCSTIISTGKPLTLFAKKQPEKKEIAAETPITPELKIVFPSGMPEEMRVPYSRMMRGQLSRGALECKIVQNNPPADLSAECDQATDETPMVLPESFDFDVKEESDAPMFKELNWGNEDSDSNTETNNDIKIEIRGDKKFAVITHDDSDFWVADGESWFATGKQKPSPIAIVIEAAKKENATPVLLLKTENIMDLKILIPKWNADGVKTIKDLSEL